MFDSLIQKKEILNFVKNSMRVEAEYIAEKKVKGQNPSLIRFYCEISQTFKKMHVLSYYL